jgi:ABC-type antimicrobial peptide transport system permease subunit
LTCGRHQLFGLGDRTRKYAPSALGVASKGRQQNVTKLVYMILFMATLTSLTGYGLGILFVTLAISSARTLSPYYAATITYWNLALAFVMVLLIAVISGYIGVRKVLRIEPFDIFRG